MSSLLQILLLIICRSLPANAWGKIGHEIVGNLAWRRLSPAAQTAVSSILGDSYSPDNSILGRISNWADEIKYVAGWHWSAALHYVDIEDTKIVGGCPVQNHTNSHSNCTFVYERDCADDRCVAGAVVNYTSRVTSTKSEQQRQALMFLVHFVGDIHQPLHVSRATDVGGNAIDVHWYATTSGHLRNRIRRRRLYLINNLHAVWDDGIIERYLDRSFNGSRTSLEEALYADVPNIPQKWLTCTDGNKTECACQWAEESLEYALAYAYRDEYGAPIMSGDNLSMAYYERCVPVVKLRLTLAGVRLASTLETALQGEMGLLRVIS